MGQEDLRSWSCKCPLCGGPVPAEIIKLHAPFDCPHCGRALQLHRLHEIAVKLLGLSCAFFLVHAVGADGFWTFCFGVMLWPFLVAPVWRASALIKRPVLSPAWSEFARLNLSGKPADPDGLEGPDRPQESGGPAAASGPSEPGYPQNKRFRCALTHSLRFTGLIETEQVSKLLESRLRCRDLRIPGARDSQALAWFLSFACSCLIHRR